MALRVSEIKKGGVWGGERWQGKTWIVQMLSIACENSVGESRES